MNNTAILERLKAGNEAYLASASNPGDTGPAVRRETAANGQRPYAVVITCSDSRVIPEAIFSAGIGELFVIRVAGNVVLESELGSIQYAAGHLGCRVILVLGHTGCGAVGAALQGGGREHSYIRFLTDEILAAIGEERDPYRAVRRNVEYGVAAIRDKLSDDCEALTPVTDVLGAVYDIETGRVEWL